MSRVFFNGRLLITPQSAALLDDSAMFNKNISVGNIAALIGRADGGEPFKVLMFGSPDEARAALKGDENTIKAIEKAFDPSNETTGPSKLAFVRVNPATQSALVLNDGTSTPSINLLSTDYGRLNNQIKVKVESGSIAGKKLTTQFGNDYYSADNIARNALSVSYAGAEVSASVSVTGTELTLLAGATSTVVELADFPSVQELVDRINATAGFSASVIDGNGEKPALFGLDFVAAADCKTAAVNITGHLQACVDWFNSTGEGFVTATRADGAGAIPANTPFAYLSGASDGMVTNAEWQKAFDALQQADVQWVTPLSSLSSIHAMTDAHVAFMSNVTKKKRRSYCGGGNSISDEDAITAAKALNSDRTSFVHLGVYDYNPKGKLTLYPAYVSAALLSGMHSGVNPGTPLTNKSIKVQGLERQLKNPTDTDALLQGGVLPLEDTPEGFKVVQSITTWRVNDNYNRTEQSVGAACDFVLRNVQEAIDGVRGKKGNPRTLQEALSRAETRLNELSKPEPMGPGVLVGDANNPPYRKLQGSLDADVISIQYECSPVIGVNYVLQVASAVPYSGSASA